MFRLAVPVPPVPLVTLMVLVVLVMLVVLAVPVVTDVSIAMVLLGLKLFSENRNPKNLNILPSIVRHNKAKQTIPCITFLAMTTGTQSLPNPFESRNLTAL